MNPFDTYFKKYDEWYEKPFGKSAYELEVKCLKSVIKNSGKALEVGVGTGRFAKALGVEFGIDTSFNMLKVAKERGIKVALAKGENMPFASEQFDSVFLVVTLCFVDNPKEVLKEAHRVLKEGGNLYLGLILKESKWAKFYEDKAKKGHPLYKHAKFYSFFELKEMVKGLFSFEDMRSTLLEEPQDLKPVRNREIKPGFYENAGFTCIRLSKKF
ncbi:MAG: class I SAM-dependent methyltransferase [Aquifex sp.]|nr:MAG: class I SAM-dependent methyltransferase [Aquifex sp.]